MCALTAISVVSDVLDERMPRKEDVDHNMTWMNCGLYCVFALYSV